MRRFLGALALMGAALCVDAYIKEVRASRNSSGTYATPNTFVTGTTISSTAVNANFADLASEMTDSLSRSGKGGALAAIRGVDGTVASPAYSWTSETGSGLFRNGSSDVRMSISGASKTFWNATGFGIGAAATAPLHVQGSIVSSAKGQAYVKGISDHGYLTIDTDSPTTKEVGLLLDSNGTKIWELYIPANSTDLRFYNGTDRFTLTSTALTLANGLNVTGDVAINTNKFTVTASSGSTAVAGDLAVTGITTSSEYMCSSYGASGTRCGAVTLDGSGNGSVTIAASHHACLCSEANTGAPAAIGCNLSGTTLTLKGTASHSIIYLCF